jgi:hypothetical protein
MPDDSPNLDYESPNGSSRSDPQPTTGSSWTVILAFLFLIAVILGLMVLLWMSSRGLDH